MRKFGVDKPEMMSFTVGDSDTIYKIPLAASLPVSVLKEMQTAQEKGDIEVFNYEVELLRTYIGDAVDGFSVGVIREIFEAWSEDTSAQGAEPGES